VSNAAPAGAPLLPCPGPGDDDDDDDTTTPATTTTTTTTPPPSRGLGAVTDALCGLTFRVSPTAFFQVNPGAAALLYRLAVDWAAPPPGGVVYDVCCGTGTLGIAAAAVAGRGGEGESATTVLGVDIEPSAIEDAVANAAANGVSAARFVAGRAEDALAGLLGDGGRTRAGAAGAVAIVDPPRAGLHPRVRAALRAAPSIARIVYVSCNPASLADDMVALCARSGGRGAPFAPVRAAAVDLFPHTAHVESVVLLERGAAA
jgi:tRNA/tmRNA/rRNA uracil-C5-methylase (TrmA/RlmC/RlmD family)